MLSENGSKLAMYVVIVKRTISIGNKLSTSFLFPFIRSAEMFIWQYIRIKTVPKSGMIAHKDKPNIKIIFLTGLKELNNWCIEWHCCMVSAFLIVIIDDIFRKFV